MSTSKGPWQLVKRDQDWDGAERLCIVDADEKPLMGDPRYYPYVPDNEADWRLIAAAPDMLAALEAIIEADEKGELCFDEIALAKEALAKARGES